MELRLKEAHSWRSRGRQGQSWTPSATDTPSAVSLPAGYLNVLVNSQWKSRWCSVRDSHLYFYQDRNRSKAAQQPLSLLGCEVVPDPSPDHLYSLRILHNGEELAKLEVPLAGAVGGWVGRHGQGGGHGHGCLPQVLRPAVLHGRFSSAALYFYFLCLRLFAFLKNFHSLSDLRVVVL